MGIREIKKQPLDERPQGDQDDGVKREEVGRERNQKIIPICQNVAACRGNFHLGDISPTQQDEEGVGVFMPRHVEVNHIPMTPAAENNGPDNGANRKEPEFSGSPKRAHFGGMTEADKEGFDGNPDNGQQQKPNEKFDRQQWSPRTKIQPPRNDGRLRECCGGTRRRLPLFFSRAPSLAIDGIFCLRHGSDSIQRIKLDLRIFYRLS